MIHGPWHKGRNAQTTIVCDITDIFMVFVDSALIELKHILTVALATYKAVGWVCFASLMKKTLMKK